MTAHPVFLIDWRTDSGTLPSRMSRYSSSGTTGRPAAVSVRMLIRGASDVVLDVGERAFQNVAIRCERALERDDPVAYVHFHCRHGCLLLKAQSQGKPSHEAAADGTFEQQRGWLSLTGSPEFRVSLEATRRCRLKQSAVCGPRDAAACCGSIRICTMPSRDPSSGVSASVNTQSLDSRQQVFEPRVLIRRQMLRPRRTPGWWPDRPSP